MNKLIIIILVILGFYQAKVDDPPLQLTVLNFKGKPDTALHFKGYTKCTVFYKIPPTKYIDNSKTTYLKVYTWVEFLENESWIKLDLIKSDEELKELLSHEQGHYDIEVVHAKHLQFKANKTRFSKLRWKFQMDSLGKVLFLHYDSLQKKYDVESGYMLNRPKQAEWKTRIHEMNVDALNGKFQ
jgi:hypothetical protein